MHRYEINDFGAKSLDISAIKSATNVSLFAFDKPNADAYGINDSFDTARLTGHSVNICDYNNAAVYWDFHGGFSLLIRRGGSFDCVAKFDTTGDSECDLDRAFCAMAIRDANG